MAEQPRSGASDASEQEPAEGSRGNVNVEGGGITNRSRTEENENQEALPPRGESKDGRDPGDEDDSTLRTQI